MRDEYQCRISLAGPWPGCYAPSGAFPKQTCRPRRSFNDQEPSVYPIGIGIVRCVSHHVETDIAGQHRHLGDSELAQHVSAFAICGMPLRASLGVGDDPTVLDVEVEHVLERRGDVVSLARGYIRICVISGGRPKRTFSGITSTSSTFAKPF